MSIPKEFLRSDKIRAICIIKNLKTDEIWLFKTEDAVKSFKDERFKLDLGMHANKKLQKAYADLGLELFTIEIETEGTPDTNLDELLAERVAFYRENGYRFY